jgi:hypothetical protein
MRARLEGPPRHVAMGLLREERGDGAVRAHAAAVSTAGPGAAAKTIRMHNKPVEPNRCPPLRLSLYKDRRHSKGGSSSSHGVRVSPPTAECFTALWSLTSRRPGGCGDVFESRLVQNNCRGPRGVSSILKRSQRAASCSLSHRAGRIILPGSRGARDRSTVRRAWRGRARFYRFRPTFFIRPAPAAGGPSWRDPAPYLDQ